MRTTKCAWLAVLPALLACPGGAQPVHRPGPPVWEACRTSAAAGARVDADAALGQLALVPGTPAFLINGELQVGAVDLATFQGWVDAARAQAAASGLARADYYQQAVVALGASAAPALEVGDAPVRGPADAWVTVVEFSDFECPYCGQVEPRLEAALAANPADLRLVYRHFPLPFHAFARPAAIAAECARQQGRFWELHDLLFQHQDRLDDQSLADDARQLGLE